MPFEWIIYRAVIAVVVALVALYGLWRVVRSRARLWRRVLVAVALVALVAAAGQTLVRSRRLHANVSAPAKYYGKQVPSFTFRLVSDDALRELAETRGKVVLINFWATW